MSEVCQVLTLLSFAFVLGVLVFVHELGHFLAAKRVGIKVLKFQLGFNPTIISFRRGDTEYGIGALPLGGYVKMAGESPEEPHSGRSDEFLSKTKWQRFQVLIMGPVMNLLLAVLVTAGVLYRGAEVPVENDQPPVIGAIAAGSPAEKAGIQIGDRITSVAGHRIDTWNDFRLAIATRPNREITIGLIRNSAPMTLQVTPTQAADSRFEIGDIGVFPDVHPRVPGVNRGEPGDRAGIKPGDVIAAVNGKTITFRSQLMEAIATHPEQPVTISVIRDGHRLDIQATPERRGAKGWLGIQIAEATKSIQPGPVEAIRINVEPNIQGAALSFTPLRPHLP